jgi:hypothetical protein
MPTYAPTRRQAACLHPAERRHSVPNTATSSKRRTHCFRAVTPTFVLQVFSSESCW